MKIKKHSCSTSTLMLVSLLGSITLSPGSAFADAPYIVTDAGNTMTPGTLRHALEVAQASDIRIAKNVGDINIDSTLTYKKRFPLEIHGKGQTIKTSLDITLLELTQGASLSVKNLDFQGPGDFDVNNRADQDGQSGKGIFIDVRDDQKGTVNMYLKNVKVSDVANYGIHISDCTLADNCGSGSGGAGDGSDASINVHIRNVTIDNAGNGNFDGDGLRVDERGKGNIFFNSFNSTFKNAGADGVELDEGDKGSIYSFTRRNTFDLNGNYCNPDKFSFDDELTFDGELTNEQVEQARLENLNETFVANKVNNDFTCVEAEAEYDADENKTTIEFGLDLDDGIDLDEAGKGSINMTMVKDTVNSNLDEGVDLDEEGKGGMFFRMIKSEVTDNRDDGVKLTEEDNGSVDTKIVKSNASGNEKGFVLEELGKGNMWFNLIKTNALNNDSDGFEVEESDRGSLEGRVIKSSSEDNDGKGFDIKETGKGSVWFDLIRTEVTSNDNDGVEIDEEDQGNLEGRVIRTTSTGNDGKGFDLKETGNGGLFVKFRRTETDNGPVGDKEDGIEADQEDAGNGQIKVRNSNIVGGTDLSGVEEI